jgi:uncharacterized short protein YbdD (DUF466 family)
MPLRLPTEPAKPSINPRDWLRAGWVTAARTARLAIGVPDYDTYVAHRRLHHADEPVMSPAEFFRSRQDARYRRGSARCC